MIVVYYMLSIMSTHIKKHKQNTCKQNTGNQPLIIAEKGEQYAMINKAVGNSKFEITIIKEETTDIAQLPNRFKSGPKKKRIEKGQYVLIQNDDSCTLDKYWIIHVYNSDDVKRLRKAGQLTQIKETSDNPSTLKTMIVFEDDVDDNVVVEKTEVTVDDTYISDL